jgi:hypothetical protein
MRRRLDVSGASGSAVASALEVRACSVGDTGLTIVVGDHFGLRLDRRLKVFDQHVSNAAMKLLAQVTQQASIGHVTHERVFEQISRVRRQALPKQQTGFDETVERRTEFYLWLARYCSQQGM